MQEYCVRFANNYTGRSCSEASSHQSSKCDWLAEWGLLFPHTQGIALSADPNYKVLGSTYPWIARRLLSDNSAELQETLRALLYKGNRFQFGRLESLLRQAVRSPPRSSIASGARPGAQVSPGARDNLKRHSLYRSHAFRSVSVMRSAKEECKDETMGTQEESQETPKMT